MMKINSIKFLIVLGFLMFAFSPQKACAQDFVERNESAFYSDFYVIQVKVMQFRITYHYPVNDRVRVRILDGRGNVLFVEKALVYKKYQKLFDLSIFNDGCYTFELTDGDQTFRQSFDIATITTRTVTAENNTSVVVAGF